MYYRRCGGGNWPLGWQAAPRSLSSIQSGGKACIAGTLVPVKLGSVTKPAELEVIPLSGTELPAPWKSPVMGVNKVSFVTLMW